MEINGITIPSGGSPTVLTSQTLIKANWSLVGSYYQYTFTNEGITSNSVITFTPDNASIIEVTTTGFLPQITSNTGNCYLYSQFPPSNDITGTIVIQ